MTMDPDGANGGGQGRERRLLISADGPQRARLRNAVRQLKSLRLLEVPSSLDALELILAGEADLCVADADDAVLGGLDLLHVALTAPGGADLPMVILASPGGVPKRSDALAAGAWDCLLKPVKPGLAAKRLELALQSLQKNGAAGPLPRVLFADPDPAYLRWAVRVLSELARVETASTVAEAAVKILRDKPALAVLARDFRPVLQRIFDARPAEFREVCHLETFEDDPDCPGAIPHNLDKHSLAQSVRRALAIRAERDEPDGDELAGLPAVLTAAVDRFFSVMTSESAEPVELADGEAAQEAWAGIEMDLMRRSGPLNLRIELWCSLELRSRLAADVYGAGGAVAAEDARSVLGEIVNVAAGRLKAFCWEQKLAVNIGLPQVSPQPPPDSRAAAPYWRGAFRWKEQTFSVACVTC